MTRLAIISDIHGNIHALEAVMQRIAQLDVSEVICLGDVVGYGPFPDMCLDMVYRYCTIFVRGNHDEAVIDMDVANMFNGAAREAIYWTRDTLGGMHLDALTRLKTLEYWGNEVMCVHDTPVFGETDYIHDKRIAAPAFRGVDRRLCLLGHTHVPMLFETQINQPNAAVEPGDVIAYLPQDGIPLQLESDKRYIANPGAVGQPRDCDPRASFAVLDTNEWTFTVHRQDYDIDAAQEATQRAGLPFVLAERLALGA